MRMHNLFNHGIQILGKYARQGEKFQDEKNDKIFFAQGKKIPGLDKSFGARISEPQKFGIADNMFSDYFWRKFFLKCPGKHCGFLKEASELGL